jgi:hypothetical protein
VDYVLNQAHLVRHDPARLVCVSRAGLNGLDEQELEDGHVLGPYRGAFEWTDEEGATSGHVLVKYENGSDEEGATSGHVLVKYENGSFVLIREEDWERFPGEEPSLSF